MRDHRVLCASTISRCRWMRMRWRWRGMSTPVVWRVMVGGQRAAGRRLRRVLHGIRLDFCRNTPPTCPLTSKSPTSLRRRLLLWSSQERASEHVDAAVALGWSGKMDPPRHLVVVLRDQRPRILQGESLPAKQNVQARSARRASGASSAEAPPPPRLRLGGCHRGVDFCVWDLWAEAPATATAVAAVEAEEGGGAAAGEAGGSAHRCENDDQLCTAEENRKTRGEQPQQRLSPVFDTKKRSGQRRNAQKDVLRACVVVTSVPGRRRSLSWLPPPAGEPSSAAVPLVSFRAAGGPPAA